MSIRQGIWIGTALDDPWRQLFLMNGAPSFIRIMTF